jgi:hypothetical protein
MFPAHGEFNIQLKGNILCFDIRGSWNLEAALAFKQQVSTIIKPLKGSRWSCFTILNDWELATPDSEYTVARLIGRCIHYGLEQEALVLSEGTLKQQIYNKYPNPGISRDPNIEFKRQFFKKEKDAIQWLSESGYSFAP